MTLFSLIESNRECILHVTSFNCQLMLQSFWHEQLQLTTRAYITFNVVNGPPGAEQIGAVIHLENLQVCTSRRSSSGWGLLTMLPSNIRGSDL